MGAPGAADSSRETGRQTTYSEHARSAERPYLRTEDRMSVGSSAPRFSAQRHGLPLFQHLAQRWHMGTDERRLTGTTPPPIRTRSHAQRREHRQPVRQNDGKGGVRGYDGGKRVKGRKRHLVVDTEGLVLKAFVSEAHYYDGTVGVWLLPGLKKRFPRLKKLWADGTYAGTFVEQAYTLAIDVEITTRLSDLPGFQVIPRRWVSERTFAWLGNYRRLSKDYEYWVYTSDATIYAVMVHIMVRRLARLQAAD